MQRNDVDRWLQVYVPGRPTTPSGSPPLFFPDVDYRYHPYDEPVLGRDVVVASWLGEGEHAGACTGDHPGTYDATYRTIAIDGDTAIATGRCREFTDGATSARIHLARTHEHRLAKGAPLMICRIWRGWTTQQNADAYQAIVRGEVIPEIEARHIPGFRAIELMRRPLEDGVEFVTAMWFDDINAVKAFIGEDYEAAHVPQRARNVLSRFDERSAHYEILDHRDQSST